VDVVEIGPRSAAQVVTVEWGRWWHIYTANGINQKYVNKQDCVRGEVGGGGNPRGRGSVMLRLADGWYDGASVSAGVVDVTTIKWSSSALMGWFGWGQR
jgi:oligoribonuclease NrnB/cAMP/cGMP phosphodiesterase (DHH superfamily)